MHEGGWLTKEEVNALYYEAVGGEIVFGTEAQAGSYAGAVATLVALQSARTGRREIRILEIGANNGVFARALLQELRGLAAAGASELVRVDYLAVEFARESLEAAVEWESTHGANDRVARGGGDRPLTVTGAPTEPTLVALLTRHGRPTTHLGLVHSEAGQYLRSTAERFDFAILNELLDDLPTRAFYADAEGRGYELLVAARQEGGIWTVRVRSRAWNGGSPADLPASSVTARSPTSIEIVTGIARRFAPGGMLLVHDYGFATPSVRVSLYERPPPVMPTWARLDLPPPDGQPFPRSFFRVFGNEAHGLIQITNDVNFAEIADALAATGSVVTLAHGNAIATDPAFSGFERGDGVFLSEIGLLRPGDDLAVVMAELERDQARLRERYIAERTPGIEAIYQDFIYVRR